MGGGQVKKRWHVSGGFRLWGPGGRVGSSKLNGSLQLYPPRIPLEGLSSLQSLALAKPAPEEASFICMFRDQRRPQESFSQGNYVLHEHSGALPKSRKNLKSKHSSHCFLQIFLTILVFIKPIFPRRKPYKNFSKNEYKNGVKKSLCTPVIDL